MRRLNSQFIAQRWPAACTPERGPEMCGEIRGNDGER